MTRSFCGLFVSGFLRFQTLPQPPQLKLGSAWAFLMPLVQTHGLVLATGLLLLGVVPKGSFQNDDRPTGCSEQVSVCPFASVFLSPSHRMMQPSCVVIT